MFEVFQILRFSCTGRLPNTSASRNICGNVSTSAGSNAGACRTGTTSIQVSKAAATSMFRSQGKEWNARNWTNSKWANMISACGEGERERTSPEQHPSLKWSFVWVVRVLAAGLHFLHHLHLHYPSKHRPSKQTQGWNSDERWRNCETLHQCPA